MRGGSEGWFVSPRSGGNDGPLPPMESLLIPPESMSTGGTASLAGLRSPSRNGLGVGDGGLVRWIACYTHVSLVIAVIR